MNISLRIFAVTFLVCLATTSAQEPTPNGPKGFEWLKQFEGTWANIPDDPNSGVENATVSARLIGQNWLVNVHRADFAGMKFEAIQTLGYDKKKKLFVGTWVDSMMKFRWEYTGSLDKSGKKIILNADGPDMQNAEIMREYRDTYEFKSKDEILATSQMKNPEGKWNTFMTATFKRLHQSKPTPKVTPFLMFIGKAEEAINFYKSVFDDTKVLNMEKYGDEEPKRKGTVKLATIEIAGQLCLARELKRPA
ncbi:MAG: DUF1579 family protein [Planctomycetota bacterium]